AALTRNVRVIPILVEGAHMPRAADLPPSMARLIRRQALTLNPDQEFESGVERLFKTLDTTLDEARKAQGSISGHLISPRDGSEVKRQEEVTCMITGLHPDDHALIIAQSPRSGLLWPQPELLPEQEGHFASRATFGRNDESDGGKEYILM